MMVGYTGYETPVKHMRDTKLVSWDGTEEWRGDKNTVHYRHNSKVEIPSCLTLSLAHNAHTRRFWCCESPIASYYACARG